MRFTKQWSFIGFAIIVFYSFGFSQKFKGLALTPPMGWNSWNTFKCNVDEQLIREMADAMVTSGMKDAGYQYVIIDDCWQGERDSLGFIHPDRNRFPSGMKALADYVHSKGLKFGLYSCAGSKTCGGRPGSRGHEYQDAYTYAQWGVDYLKYDWCYTEGLNSIGAYTTMRDALYAAGRPIVFSICEWGDTKPWEWAKEVGHLWRTTGDIIDCFDCEVNHGSWSSWGVLKIVDMRRGIRQYAGPDHWNDPDMLEVGRGMTTAEDRAHFSLWCMMAAPLIAGNDLRTMSKETIEILTNKEVIAIDQDSLGIQGMKFIDNYQGVEVWIKPLKNNDWAVCFLNRSEVKRKIQFDWSKHWITDDISKRTLDTQSIHFIVRDVWAKKNIGTTQKPLVGEVGIHDVLLVRLIHPQNVQ
ncbi:MAG: glycoside hydrolase family 27 protein [Bacteroidetes bacterium]|nr:glycoside hydrolase family 27 protein [Bacteroidota bacterium]